MREPVILGGGTEMITVIVPCLNEEINVTAFYNEIQKVKFEINDKLELFFIDDGSKDGTLTSIKLLAQKDENVHYISFSRNFGKEAAILAGLENTQSEYVAVMDIDLQDPPELLPQMYYDLSEGIYDCVAARRINRSGEPFIRSMLARFFYSLVNRLSDIRIEPGARDYRMMSRRMVDAIISDREYNRFSKGIFAWVGYETKWIEYDNIKRNAGKTKWSLKKLFKYSVDGILACSTVPLSLASWMGILMCGFSFFMLLIVVGRALVFGDPVAGWPSLVSVIIFIGGMLMLNLGIVGLYISKIYLETKKRQIYIIKEQG